MRTIPSLNDCATWPSSPSQAFPLWIWGLFRLLFSPLPSLSQTGLRFELHPEFSTGFCTEFCQQMDLATVTTDVAADRAFLTRVGTAFVNSSRELLVFLSFARIDPTLYAFFRRSTNSLLW